MKTTDIKSDNVIVTKHNGGSEDIILNRQPIVKLFTFKLDTKIEGIRTGGHNLLLVVWKPRVEEEQTSPCNYSDNMRR